jgi:hypothetical protein
MTVQHDLQRALVAIVFVCGVTDRRRRPYWWLSFHSPDSAAGTSAARNQDQPAFWEHYRLMQQLPRVVIL